MPSTPDIDAVGRRDVIYKQQQAANYNRRHNPREGRKWVVGDRVWVTDVKVEATVTDVLPFRSFQLRTAAGTTIRRNGRALRHALPPPTTTSATPMTSSSVPLTEQRTNNNGRCRVRETVQPPLPATLPQQPVPVLQTARHHGRTLIPSPVMTRSGRHVRRPDRFNL